MNRSQGWLLALPGQVEDRFADFFFRDYLFNNSSMILRYYRNIKRIMTHGKLCSLWVRRSKRPVAVGSTADRGRRVFSPIAVLGLRRILRSRFWDNKLHGITNQNEFSARCAAIMPCFAAKAPPPQWRRRVFPVPCRMLAGGGRRR